MSTGPMLGKGVKCELGPLMLLIGVAVTYNRCNEYCPGGAAFKQEKLFFPILAIFYPGPQNDERERS